MLSCCVPLGGQKQQPTPVVLQPSQCRLHWRCVGSGATDGSPSCCAAAGLAPGWVFGGCHTYSALGFLLW